VLSEELEAGERLISAIDFEHVPYFIHSAIIALLRHVLNFFGRILVQLLHNLQINFPRRILLSLLLLHEQVDLEREGRLLLAHDFIIELWIVLVEKSEI